MPTLAPATKASAAPALSFDERLSLAALAVDARLDTRPLDLADVICVPVDEPQQARSRCPYSTPIAALLYRARTRIEAGWCTGRLRDEAGARCLIGAIQAEAGDTAGADDACRVLLDAIRRDLDPDAETVPSWNDNQTGPRLPLRALDRAAAMADAQGI
jgi:hypothetical protein